jgi:hypothetical protein
LVEGSAAESRRTIFVCFHAGSKKSWRPCHERFRGMTAPRLPPTSPTPTYDRTQLRSVVLFKGSGSTKLHSQAVSLRAGLPGRKLIATL